MSVKPVLQTSTELVLSRDAPAAPVRRRPSPQGRPDLVWPGKLDNESTRPQLTTVGHGDNTVARLEPREVVGDGGGILVVGDADSALPALAQPELNMRGRVKLAYLDPPFNTGASFEHYRDSIDTASWLSALRRRLQAVRPLLHPQGSVWLHLDDSHQHHGRCLLDEVFGAAAFVATVIWQRRTSRDNRKAFSAAHDYLHVYSLCGAKAWKSIRNGMPDQGYFSNPDEDERGPWRSVPLTVQAGHATKSQFYTIVSPSGVSHEPPQGRCWTYTLPRFRELLADNKIYWPRGGDGKPRLKRFTSEVGDLAPSTMWFADDVGDTAESKKEVLQLSTTPSMPFDTPKPERLMERILHISTDPGDMVLDPYLGSGTTAAVSLKMRRQWVGIEVEPSTVDSIVVPRLRSVVDGTDMGGVSDKHGWQGGGGYQMFRVATTS